MTLRDLINVARKLRMDLDYDLVKIKDNKFQIVEKPIGEIPNFSDEENCRSNENLLHILLSYPRLKDKLLDIHNLIYRLIINYIIDLPSDTPQSKKQEKRFQLLYLIADELEALAKIIREIGKKRSYKDMVSIKALQKAEREGNREKYKKILGLRGILYSEDLKIIDKLELK